MSESTFTPFYLIVCILISLALAYLEIAWLGRTFHQVQWIIVMLIAVTNFLLLLIGYFVLTTYLFVFFFPIPIVPALFILVKVGIYTLIKRKTGIELQSLWMVSTVMILSGSLVSSLILSFAKDINPTNQNFYRTVESGSATKLEVMLRLSIKNSKMMNTLLIEALSNNNIDALTRLCQHGGKISVEEPYNYGSLETSWQYFRFQLDHVKPLDSILYLDIALSHYSADQLEYAFQKGFDPKKYPHLIHEVLRNHNRRVEMVHVKDSQQDLLRKLSLLFQHGASIDDIDQYGYKPISALFASRCNSKFQILKMLMAEGANPNEQTTHAININESHFMPPGFTPLMSAVLLDDVDCVNLLITNGTNRHLKNSEGKTAIDYVQDTDAGQRIEGILSDTKLDY